MTIREELEKNEELTLSKYACLSSKSLGRDFYEEPCELRTIFSRDRDRIIHSKSFRRLKHKTQVFLNPEGDHYRTRLTHTIEVSQIARTIAKSLRLNEDLTEAIALGHDLGHTPFGHAGEKALNNLLPQGFEHCFQSLRIVEKLEKDGIGLNLSKEVKDGILNHRTSGNPITLEGQAVRFADKIAYINHDIDDGINAKIIAENDVPDSIKNILGKDVHTRIDFLIKNLIFNSLNKNKLQMSDDVYKAMYELRSWLFENLYNNSVVKNEEIKAKNMVETLFNYYYKNQDEMPNDYLKFIDRGEDTYQVVADYISEMSDDFAIYTFKNIYLPKSWGI